MDVKLGQRSYDPFASQEKREQQIRKYPLMEEIGFLVLGMRVSVACGRSDCRTLEKSLCNIYLVVLSSGERLERLYINVVHVNKTFIPFQTDTICCVWRI